MHAAMSFGRSARTRRAEALVNPASGLANDYLNLFNEILMLIEHLPTMPELYDDIERWRPQSYQDYFRRSVLPGRGTALEAYDRLDTEFRASFEAAVSEVDRRATGAVAAVRRLMKTGGDRDTPSLAALCERAGTTIREALDRATALVNFGKETNEADSAQKRADLLFARLAAP